MLAVIKKPFQVSVLPWVTLWLLYMGLYSVIKSYATLSGVTEFIGINGLNLLLAILFFVFWKQVKTGILAKRVFLFFALAYCFTLIDSSIYHFIYNILHFSRSQVSLLWLSAYNIPYWGYLLFKFLAWATILFAVKTETKKSIRVYLPLVLVFFAIFLISIFAVKWDVGSLSLMAVYDFADKILEVGCMIAIAICLVAAKNKGFFYLATGALIGTVSSTIMDFGLFSQGYGFSSIFETGWILSRLLMIYGLINLSCNNKLSDVRSWIASPNSIRAQAAYWSFVVLMVFLVVAFVTLKLTAPAVFF